MEPANSHSTDGAEHRRQAAASFLAGPIFLSFWACIQDGLSNKQTHLCTLPAGCRKSFASVDYNTEAICVLANSDGSTADLGARQAFQSCLTNQTSQTNTTCFIANVGFFAQYGCVGECEQQLVSSFNWRGEACAQKTSKATCEATVARPCTVAASDSAAAISTTLSRAQSAAPVAVVALCMLAAALAAM
jgi:hypothetical protein